MGSSISFKSQKKAAKHLAFARDRLRSEFMLRGIDRNIPLPQSLQNFNDEKKDSDTDSDSTDSEIDSVDHTDDGIIGDEGEAQPRAYTIIPTVVSSQLSLEEQHAIRNFEFVHSTFDNLDLPEGAQGQRDSEEFMEDIAQTQSEGQATTHTYPNPEASELCPPPTPILSHAELPLPSIEMDTPDNEIKELPDAAMQDWEDGDLSDITHTLGTGDHPLSPAESNAIENIIGRMTDAVMQDPENRHLLDIPNPGLPLSSMKIDEPDNTTSETTDAIMEDSEDGDLSHSARLLHDKSWWQEFENWLQDRQCIAQTPASSLNLVAFHQHGSAESRKTDSIEDSLPEQPAAEELTAVDTTVGNLGQDIADDAILALIKEDIETMEAEAETSRAKRERRRIRCRVHNALDAEHHHRSQICRSRPLCVAPVSMREPRPYTKEKIQSIRAERFSMPLWKKHCVWQRSLLVKETRLMPLLNNRRLHKTYSIYHEGKGVTGGDLETARWKYCNLCAGNCNGR